MGLHVQEGHSESHLHIEALFDLIERAYKKMPNDHHQEEILRDMS